MEERGYWLDRSNYASLISVLKRKRLGKITLGTIKCFLRYQSNRLLATDRAQFYNS